MKKTTILFDLDGTLVNTERGITNCVQLALKAFGITDAAPGTLRRFIGPPVEESFQREYGFSVEKAKEATAIFRREYRVTGVNECELYPGVEDALKALRQKKVSDWPGVFQAGAVLPPDIGTFPGGAVF